MDDEPRDFVSFKLDLRVCPHMVGAKTAVQYGTGPVYVSPAQFDLLRHADAAELEFLLRTIPVLVLPARDNPHAAIETDWSNL